MTLRRLTAVFVVITAIGLAAATTAVAKEDVKATLVTSIPVGAPPGTELRVGWTLDVDDGGRPRPFNALNVFVRLLSATGAAAEEGFAANTAHPTGDYEATVVVPEGGIGDVEIGLQGWSSPGGRSDALFTITNDPLPGALSTVSQAAPPASGEEPEGRTTSRDVAVAVAVVSAALVGLGLALRGRRLRRATSPSASAAARGR